MNTTNRLFVNTISMPFVYFKEAEDLTGDAKGLFTEGINSINNRLVRESVSCFAKALNLAPTSPSIINNLGVLCVTSLGEQGEGIRLFENGINKNPKVPQLRYNYGNFLYQHRSYREAKNQLEQANSLLPENNATINNLGLACLALNEVNEARKHFNQTITIDSKFTIGYHNLAQTYYNEKDFENAILYYTKAIETNEDSVPSLNDLGCVYYQLGDTEKALLYISKAIRVIEKYNEQTGNSIDNQMTAPYCNFGYIAEKRYAEKGSF